MSTAALRRCSIEFADLLSPSASARGTRMGDAHEWRYTSEDVTLLGTIRDLVNQGLGVQQVRARLASAPEHHTSPDPAPSPEIIATLQADPALAEVVSTQRSTIIAFEG